MKAEKGVGALNKNNSGTDYAHLLAEVKERIRSAQYEALKAVNKELVGLYWDVGRMIVERQRDTEHGTAIVEQLSSDLRTEFPGISGFSRRNVFYMREFYLLYRDDKRVQPLVAQIGWTHNLVIFQRCKDPLEREFYLRMTRKFGWSKNVLIHQIDNQNRLNTCPFVAQDRCRAVCTGILPVWRRKTPPGRATLVPPGAPRDG